MKLFPLLIPAGLAAALLATAGCATPTAAIQQRTRLATLAETNANQAAGEVDTMAKKIATDEYEKVKAEKVAEYNKAMARVTTPEEGAQLGYNFAKDMREIDINGEAEKARLLQVGAKVRATGKAAKVLDEMATKESDLAKVTSDLVFDEVIPAAIAIAEQVQANLAAKEAERAAKLAVEAEASKPEPPAAVEPETTDTTTGS